MRWTTYPNPMRSDGVFVGTIAGQTPYEGASSMSGPVYPAVPFKSISFDIQFPQDEAGRLVDLLNTCPQVEAAIRWLLTEDGCDATTA